MPGEIQSLCEIAQPNMGLITNISAAHIENFDNIQHIAKTKSALFTCLSKGGTAFINMDDEHIPNIYVDANKFLTASTMTQILRVIIPFHSLI